MWAHQLTGPGRIDPVETPDPRGSELAPGKLIARFEAGGICGSDLPSFLGVEDLIMGRAHGLPGYPLHELVGEVVESAAGDVPVGARIVGWADRHQGLAEYFVARADNVLVLDGEALTPARATVIQPLCTVLHAVERLGDLRGARVAVIGQGSIGTLFSHTLKRRGAAHVTGVDPIDRRDVASAFGVDECVWDTAVRWAARLGDDDRPDIVVEAVGHQAGTLDDAVHAVAVGGTVLGFGVPDDAYYAFPFARFFRKNATLIGGVTTERRSALAAARDYLVANGELLDPYITDVFPASEAQAAFELAAHPAAGRLKVVFDGP
jgi:threonine dehydrogenase-like Zn-dependent dehydrogenase